MTLNKTTISFSKYKFWEEQEGRCDVHSLDC